MAGEATTSTQRPGRAARITGWALSILIAVFIGSGGINALRSADFVVAGMTRFGFTPSALTGIGIAELLCAVLFLIPRTAALGAILFTAFLGGAVVTHARVGDPMWVVPVVFGVVVWVALLLREPRYNIIRPSQYGGE